MIHDITSFFTQFPASSYYHALAFLGTAFLSQYSVQIIKVISKNKLGKNTLRVLNGAFNTAFVAAGALAAGGLSIGNVTISAAALSTFSVLIYRVHNSLLYKQYSGNVDDIVNAEVPTDVSTSQFAS